jgi:hypothetical protein
VNVLFGAVPVGTPAGVTQLPPFDSLKIFTALPSAKQPLIVFRGVTSGGKSALFTIVGEAIIRGTATCLPNASQCQVIQLKPGQLEQLEYLAPTGQVTTYELRLVTIASTTTTASSASLKNAVTGDSKAVREMLGRAGLRALPGLRYSQGAGVLVAVPAPHAHPPHEG